MPLLYRILSVVHHKHLSRLKRSDDTPDPEATQHHDTHDYKRNGMTTLFATLSILYGKVIGGSMLRAIDTRGLFASRFHLDCIPTASSWLNWSNVDSTESPATG